MSIPFSRSCSLPSRSGVVLHRQKLLAPASSTIAWRSWSPLLPAKPCRLCNAVGGVENFSLSGRWESSSEGSRIGCSRARSGSHHRLDGVPPLQNIADVGASAAMVSRRNCELSRVCAWTKRNFPLPGDCRTPLGCPDTEAPPMLRRRASGESPAHPPRPASAYAPRANVTASLARVRCSILCLVERGCGAFRDKLPLRLISEGGVAIFVRCQHLFAESVCLRSRVERDLRCLGAAVTA